MVLSDIDRTLLQRCFQRTNRAWEDFVDRYVGLVVHVINHTSSARSISLTPEDVEDLVAEVFVAIINNDFAILRKFRGESSLATYLTVVSRRVVVRELLKRKPPAVLGEVMSDSLPSHNSSAEERISNRDEVEQLLTRLDGSEKDVVRMYHLEGKTYQEISTATGMPENSVGPTLSRAREKLRRTGS